MVAFTESEDESDTETERWLLHNLEPYTGLNYIKYMDHIGWPPAGVLTNLLSQADYRFRQAPDNRTITRLHWERVAPALAVLVFEQ